MRVCDYVLVIAAVCLSIYPQGSPSKISCLQLTSSKYDLRLLFLELFKLHHGEPLAEMSPLLLGPQVQYYWRDELHPEGGHVRLHFIPLKDYLIRHKANFFTYFSSNRDGTWLSKAAGINTATEQCRGACVSLLGWSFVNVQGEMLVIQCAISTSKERVHSGLCYWPNNVCIWQLCHY